MRSCTSTCSARLVGTTHGLEQVLRVDVMDTAMSVKPWKPALILGGHCAMLWRLPHFPVSSEIRDVRKWVRLYQSICLTTLLEEELREWTENALKKNSCCSHEWVFAVSYFSVSVLISPIIMTSTKWNIKKEDSQVKSRNPEQSNQQKKQLELIRKKKPPQFL